MRRFPRLCVLLLPLSLLLAACGGGNDDKGVTYPEITNPATVPAGRKVNLVVTTTQIADFGRVVGGDRVNVTGLAQPGADLHDFQPAPADAQRVAEADLIAVNGVGLDDYLAGLLKEAGGKKPVAVLSKGVTLREGAAHEDEDEHANDPHIWLDPRNAKVMVTNLAEALAKVDPAGASVYNANAAAYNARIDELDRQIQAQIETLPRERRKVVTNHDALGYYLNRYGLTFVGSVIPNLDSNTQPSAKEVAEIVTKIREQGVPAIFAESSINPALAQQIATEAGVKVVATLYADSLGPQGSGADTYIGMMEHNTRAIVDGLR